MVFDLKAHRDFVELTNLVGGLVSEVTTVARSATSHGHHLEKLLSMFKIQEARIQSLEQRSGMSEAELEQGYQNAVARIERLTKRIPKGGEPNKQFNPEDFGDPSP